MREGFYSIEYGSTQVGSGLGILVFDTGMIVGCDTAGSPWDGAYQYNPKTGMLDCSITVKMSAGTVSTVTGRQSQTGMSETYNIALPREIGAEFRTTINFDQGFPMNVCIRKIRDFPN